MVCNKKMNEIETLFFDSLKKYISLSNGSMQFSDCRDVLIPNSAEEFYSFEGEIRITLDPMSSISFSIFPQAPIHANKRKYILDFEICVIHTTESRNCIMHDFAVEIDGHEWHEKTKEQVARDKARERDLLRSNIRVIRFSGYEVFHDPLKAANETWSIIIAALSEDQP
jgi:hypothetical protein